MTIINTQIHAVIAIVLSEKGKRIYGKQRKDCKSKG